MWSANVFSSGTGRSISGECSSVEIDCERSSPCSSLDISLLILAVIVAALGGVLVFAVLCLAVAAREANRRLREGGAEAGVLTAAL